MRFVSFADAHIHNYTAFDKDGSRLKNSLRAIHDVFKYAHANGIDTILFAGDLFEKHGQLPHQVWLSTVALFTRMFKTFPDMYFFAVSGNHDYASVKRVNNHGTSALRLLDHFFDNFFLLDCVDGLNVPKFETDEGNIYGIPYYHYAEDYWTHMNLIKDQLNSSEVNIGLTHATIFGYPNIAGVIDASDPMFKMFDFTVSGDIHDQTFLEETNFLMCGSLLQQKADDAGSTKGFWDITVTKKGHERLFIPTKSPEFVRAHAWEDVGDNYKLEIIEMPEIVDSAVNVEAFTSGKSNAEMLRSYGEEVGLTEEQITIGLSFL